MDPIRTFVRSFSTAIAALVFAGCSFQNFDYLKEAYKSPAGGANGSGGAHPSGGDDDGGDAGSSDTSRAGSNHGGTAGASAGAGAGAIAGAGSGGTGGETIGQAGEGGAPPEPPPGKLSNPGFELGSATSVSDWLNDGDTAAAFVDFNDAHSGSGRLGHWLATGTYKVSTHQIVKPLPSGSYTFKIWVAHAVQFNMTAMSEYIFARRYSTAQPAAEMRVDTSTANDATYTQIVISHIPVTNGQCDVGIFSNGDADSATNWSRIDDAELTLEPPPG